MVEIGGTGITDAAVVPPRALVRPNALRGFQDTLIRHSCLGTLASPVASLTLSMQLPATCRGLIAPIRALVSLPPRRSGTAGATVAIPAITASADGHYSIASVAAEQPVALDFPHTRNPTVPEPRDHEPGSAYVHAQRARR